MENILENHDMKYCRCGNHMKPKTEFHYDSYKKDGLNGTCKVCIRKRNNARYPKIKENRLIQKQKAKTDELYN